MLLMLISWMLFLGVHSLQAPLQAKLLGTLLPVMMGTDVWVAFLMGGLHLWLDGVLPFTRAG